MKKLDIIYEDKNYLVVNKPAKKLTIANNKTKYNTLYHEAREYVKKQNPHNKIFIVHRLDEQTSGIVLFAKNEKLKHLLQDNWSKYQREYIAIVEGKLKEKKQTIKQYLVETKSLEVYPTNNPKVGKLAITNYVVIKEKNEYSLLNISINTGRRNQIRVAMSSMGHPIIGDKKYHATNNPIRRLGLHASKLILKDPISKKEMTFVTQTPKSFTKMM